MMRFKRMGKTWLSRDISTGRELIRALVIVPDSVSEMQDGESQEIKFTQSDQDEVERLNEFLEPLDVRCGVLLGMNIIGFFDQNAVDRFETQYGSRIDEGTFEFVRKTDDKHA